jgi:hypothetical protein
MGDWPAMTSYRLNKICTLYGGLVCYDQLQIKQTMYLLSIGDWPAITSYRLNKLCTLYGGLACYHQLQIKQTMYLRT